VIDGLVLPHTNKVVFLIMDGLDKYGA